MASRPDESSEHDGSRSTRRKFLAGGVGAGAAVIVGTVAKSAPAGAATGDNLVLGGSNSASNQTFIDATSVPAGTPAFQVNVTGKGSGAIFGATGGGIGVQGSDYGKPLNLQGLGLYGTSDLGDGCLAQGGRNGVRGIGGTGPGVLAQNSGSGPALQVDGTAIFSRSGLVSIAGGATTATVTGVSLTASSLVLATMQNSLHGVEIQAAVPNVAGSSIEIVLKARVPAGKTAEVGWFIVN